MTFNLIENAKKTNAGANETGAERQLAMQFRGDHDVSPGIAEWTRKGRDCEKKGDMENAVKCYTTAVKTVADPINYLAWAYHVQGEEDKALALSRVAVDLMPGDANNHDTLAEILFVKGEKTEALNHMEQALKLDSRFQEKFEQFQKKINP